MTNPTSRPDGPSIPLLVAGCILAAIAGAVLVLLYVFSPEPRPSLDDELGHWLPYIIAGGPAIAAYLGIRNVKGNQVISHEKLDTIERQTNGVLDSRIRTQVGTVLMRAGLASEDASHASGIGPKALPFVAVDPATLDAVKGLTPAVVGVGTVGLEPSDLEDPPGMGEGEPDLAAQLVVDPSSGLV